MGIGSVETVVQDSRIVQINKPRRAPVSALWGAVFAAFTAAAAEEAAETPATTGSEPALEAIDQRVRVLERLREVDAEEAAKKKEKAATISHGPRGLKVQNADSSNVLRLGGFLQSIAYYYPGDTADVLSENFMNRRARLDIRGQVGKHFEFRLHPDFAGGTLVLLDAHADFVLAPEFRVRFGKFKPPIGYERLQSPGRLHFPDFALTSVLTPNRDLGLEFSGALGEANVLEYALGAFNGAPDGGVGNGDNNGDKDAAGRILLSPFRLGAGIDLLYDLSVGLSGSAGYHNVSLPSYTASTRAPNRFFAYRAADTAQGRVIRWSPHATYYYGPLSGIGEYVSTTHKTRAGRAAPEELTHTAWQATAGYVLTGENAGWKGIKPRKPLDLDSGWVGAWEAVARVHQVKIDGDAFPAHADPANAAREAFAWGAGINWHANENFKLQLNYETTTYEGGAPWNGDRPQEHVAQASFNVTY